MNKLQLRNMILDQIERPQIPDARYSVLEFGVKADSEAIQTAFLQKAIDTISGKGGGRLVIPAGHYRTGSLHLKSKVELHLESEQTVLAFVSEHPEVHYPVVYSHWEASPCYNFSALIYACDAEDIAVTGKGILDGGADKTHWWDWHHQVEEAWSLDRADLQLADRKALRKMNEDGVPVEKRIFGPGHYLRPNFIQMIRCQRILLQGISLKRSPMWQLNPVMCQSLTIDGVTLSSHGSNNDGCDPESCRGVHIVNCRFDTGDDCISIKSGRDRDGREADIPCEYVLIENNDFADGHGGVALGSEMSGGIRYVLAWNNRFSSPNLTYALRLKANARRGGRVEDIILADSVLTKVHGAAVHGTMLYEDGRNGCFLPEFKNITIENIKACGGDYGIFLEAFDEVPITGLVLKNILIEGAAQAMHSMNWKDPVVENVVINGQRFPRPGKVRILGLPVKDRQVKASAQICGGDGECQFIWETGEKEKALEDKIDGADEITWKKIGEGKSLVILPERGFLRLTARDNRGNEVRSRSYKILSREITGTKNSEERLRLVCRGILKEEDNLQDEEWISRGKLACMLLLLTDQWEKKFREEEARFAKEGNKEQECVYLKECISQGFLAKDEEGGYRPEGNVTRQEMATVAMQACGINYRNASSTMPVCADVSQIGNNYGTNVARALYFGFMKLDEHGFFRPGEPVSVGEAIKILNRVADFAGI